MLNKEIGFEYVMGFCEKANEYDGSFKAQAFSTS
jgi:hypothetical protein